MSWAIKLGVRVSLLWQAVSSRRGGKGPGGNFKKSRKSSLKGPFYIFSYKEVGTILSQSDWLQTKAEVKQRVRFWGPPWAVYGGGLHILSISLTAHNTHGFQHHGGGNLDGTQLQQVKQGLPCLRQGAPLLGSKIRWPKCIHLHLLLK